MRRRSRTALITICAAALSTLALVACGPPPDPAPQFDHFDPITLGHGGVPGNASASGASVSADGRWTAFRSAASNLVAGDTNGAEDTFLRDNSTGAVTRIAESTLDAPMISRNGRYVGVKFADGATYGVHDRIAGTTSTWTGFSGQTVPVVTDDGTRAVHGTGSSFGIFSTHCNLRDLTAGVTTSCPRGPADYGAVALVGVSGNGRHVMYHWLDQSGGGTSAYYLWDVVSGQRVVLDGDFVALGVSNVVSDDGSTIFAAGFGTSLPPHIFDVASGTAEPFPGSPDGTVMPTGISPDGRWFSAVSDATNLVPDDTNDAADMFLLDRSDSSLSVLSRSFDSGAQLGFGGWHCGKSAGQVLDGGRVCVLAADEISSADSNGAVDAFLTPAR